MHPDYPRAGAYHPDWIAANGMGSPTLWLTEWLTGDMDLQPGMRILDLGCGRAVSSVFLAREFDVQVWAVDLWIRATDNARRIADAGCERQVFPLHCDARSLPFAENFFDAIVCVDSFSYYGTDSLYLNYLARFVRDGGRIGIAGAGLTREVETIPEHLQPIWEQDFWALHSAAWWRQLWERTGILAIEAAGEMPKAAENWLRWQRAAHPENSVEIDCVAADAGRTLTYVRTIGRRSGSVPLVDYCQPDTLMALPADYQPKPVLR